jgi:hypothetical protein
MLSKPRTFASPLGAPLGREEWVRALTSVHDGCFPKAGVLVSQSRFWKIPPVTSQFLHHWARETKQELACVGHHPHPHLCQPES